MSGSQDLFGEVLGGRDFEAEFHAFWAIFPKRHGNPKAPARAEWIKLAMGHKLPPLALMLASVRAFNAHHQKEKTDPKFIPHARTWLHQQRWNDWVQPETAAPKPVVIVQDWADADPKWKAFKAYVVARDPRAWVDMFQNARTEPRDAGRCYLLTNAAMRVNAQYEGVLERFFGVGAVMVCDEPTYRARMRDRRGE
jgi:hypothetical protein